MNLLIEKPRDYLIIGGKKIAIKTDFDVWVRFIIASKHNNDEEIVNALVDIFGDLTGLTTLKDTMTAISDWLEFNESDNAPEERDTEETVITSQQAIDFESDGNIIYCELWQYFPELMKRGINFYEGMELLKILLLNEKTNLWHRAFARTGNFAGMSNEQRKYWKKERTRYRITAKKMTQKEIDNVMSNMFFGEI